MLQRMVVLMVGTVALLGVGCGSDGGQSSSDTTAAVVTKAQFVKSGDAICTNVNSEVAEGLERFRDEYGLGEKQALNKTQEVKFASVSVIPQIKGELGELEALQVPPADEAEISAMLQALSRGAAVAASDPALLFLAKKFDPLRSASAMARDYGFKVCGQE